MTYPGPYIYISQVRFDMLAERGWDMQYYRVAPAMAKAPLLIEHDPKEKRP